MMMSTRINDVLCELVEREGGFVNCPDDSGGPTKYGITLDALSEFFGRQASIKELKSLSRDTAYRIYRDRYINAPHFDVVLGQSVPVAEELIDTGVNMGAACAARFLQRALNVFNQQAALFTDLRVDGKVGGLTLSALESYLTLRRKAGERVLLKALNCLQGSAYIELAEARQKDETFVYGWLKNRVVLAA